MTGQRESRSALAASRAAGMWGVLIALACLGCKVAPCRNGLETVSAHLATRMGQSIPNRSGDVSQNLWRASEGKFVLPPGASLEDGLTEDEAVSIALWNNAAFQELLVDLGIARGDLIQAGLLPNPEFVYFWPVSDKPFKYLFDMPLEAIWLRPIRVRSAAMEAERVSERLAQAGLDLARDTRQAYADLALAHERRRIAIQATELRGRVAGFAEKRLQAGDISPQESATAKIDALQAEQDATRISYEAPILEERLRNLMGVGILPNRLNLDPGPVPFQRGVDVNALVQMALAERPDALAANEALAAAEARLTFAKVGWVRLLGLLDATSGQNGHEFGPAARITVPIFNRNQGAIARAEAELERALRNRKTVANQIIMDVRRAELQYRQANAELATLLQKVRPELEGATSRAQGAYERGNVTIFIVLDTTRQLLDNYLREAQLHGDLRRTWAELERSVGRRLGPLSLDANSGDIQPNRSPTDELLSVSPAEGEYPDDRIQFAREIAACRARLERQGQRPESRRDEWGRTHSPSK